MQVGETIEITSHIWSKFFMCREGDHSGCVRLISKREGRLVFRCTCDCGHLGATDLTIEMIREAIKWR